MEEENAKRMPLKRRLEILDYIKDHPNEKLTRVAARFGISKQRLNNLRKKEGKNREVAETGMDLRRSTVRQARHPVLENALFKWLTNVSRQGFTMNGKLIREKAAYFAEAANIHDFRASDGWFSNFKERWEISFRIQRGRPSSSMGLIENRLIEILNEMSKYPLTSVFCCDEVTLFWHSLPCRSLTTSTCDIESSILSVLLCTNVDGSKKAKPLVVGVSEISSCERDDFMYRSSPNAWQTGDLLADWLREFDSTVNEPTLLLLDNRLYKKIENQNLNLSYVDIIAYLPKSNILIPPMEQGITKVFACVYHQLVIQHYMIAENSKSVIQNFTIENAIYFVSQAWCMVNCEAISTCWKQSGLCGDNLTMSIFDVNSVVLALQADIEVIPEELILSYDRITSIELLIAEKEVQILQELKQDLAEYEEKRAKVSTSSELSQVQQYTANSPPAEPIKQPEIPCTDPNLITLNTLKSVIQYLKTLRPYPIEEVVKIREVIRNIEGKINKE